jgi:hypothetical protein
VGRYAFNVTNFHRLTPRRFDRRTEDSMMRSRFVWASAALAISALQAWNAGGFEAGTPVLALVVVAILAPTAAIALTSGPGVQFGAIVCSLVLLTVARIVSPVPLNTLHLAAVFPAVVLIGRRVLLERDGPQGPGRLPRSAT